MTRMLVVAALAAISATWVRPADAQIADHLKCYRIKDPLARGSYTGDLGASDSLPADSGCVIKTPAKLLCVDTTKTNVVPPPPGSGAGRLTSRFVCYKVRCPRGTLPPVDWTDQFGTRTVQPVGPKMVCAPEPAPPGPPCVTGGCAVCGSCGDGRCHLTGGGGGCGTFDGTPQCVSASSCVPTLCNSHAQCGTGQVCVFTSGPPGSACCTPCP
jgi:hypothetical protein